MQSTWLVVVSSLGVLLAGCSDPDQRAISYSEPPDYTFTVSLGAPIECGGWNHGTYRVEVDSHEVVRFWATSDDDQWQIDNLGVGLEDIPTLAEIVDSSLAATARGDDVVSLLWDDQTGHPVSLCVDPDAADTVDDEWGYVVSDVVPDA